MGALAANAALANRRAACSAREAEEALRALEEERRRGDALQEQVWELQGLLAQSQSNHDALLKAFGDARTAPGGGGVGGSGLYVTEGYRGVGAGSGVGAGAGTHAALLRASLDALACVSAARDPSAGGAGERPVARCEEEQEGGRPLAREADAQSTAPGGSFAPRCASPAALPLEVLHESTAVARAKRHLRRGREDAAGPGSQLPVPPQRLNPDVLTVARWEAFNARLQLLQAVCAGRATPQDLQQLLRDQEPEGPSEQQRQAQMAQEAAQAAASELGGWSSLDGWGAGGGTTWSGGPPGRRRREEEPQRAAEGAQQAEQSTGGAESDAQETETDAVAVDPDTSHAAE